jgi:hypothetical protein
MKKPFVITLFFVVLAIHPAEGQEKYLLPGTWSDGPEDRLAENEFTFLQQPSSDQPDAEGDAFTFVRIQYDNAGGGLDDDWGWGRRGTWRIDYPDADLNFLRGVRRLTNIHINSSPAVLRLDDDRIFEYRFLYMLELGRNGGPRFTE